MWRSIEEKIALYSQLTAEEQHEVEQYVKDHPEMSPLLDEAKAFGTLLQEGRLLHTDPTSDEALAYYIATRRYSAFPAPAHLQNVFDRIEERLAHDPSARARYEELERRIVALEASSNPLQQFERLSGHRLHRPSPSPFTPPSAENTAADPSPPFSSRPTSLRSPRHWAIAAVVIGILLYGALGLISHFSQSKLVQIAALDVLSTDEPFQFRTETARPDPASPDGRYDQARAVLNDARSSILGLFPRYSEDRLEEAAALLQDVIAQTPADSYLHSEAYYILARIRLAREDVPGARAAFQAVLNGSGWRVAETNAMLDQVDTLSD